MSENKIITVDYSQTFRQMLEKSPIPAHQIGLILRQLDDIDIKFNHKGIVSFEVHDFVFNEPTATESANHYIRTHNPESRWKPFDIEHILVYHLYYPEDVIFKKNHVFASRRKFKVGGVDHIAVLSYNFNNSSFELELVEDSRSHTWAPGLSAFPGQRKIKKVA